MVAVEVGMGVVGAVREGGEMGEGAWAVVVGGVAAAVLAAKVGLEVAGRAALEVEGCTAHRKACFTASARQP